MAGEKFSRTFVTHWRALHSRIKGQQEEVVLDGRNLNLAALVACARYGLDVAVDEGSWDAIARHTSKVFGDAGDVQSASGQRYSWESGSRTRASAIEEKQRAIIRDSHCSILVGETDFDNTNVMRTFTSAIPLSDQVHSSTMPEPWVRATLMIRLNTLTYETAGVRPALLTQLVHLLNFDVIPRIPLRGSVSGAGDSSPLSYIGGVLQGKPAVQAWVGDRIQGGRKLVPGDEALNYAEIEGLEIRAKEGLAIVTGTAPSAAIAALALHEALCLAATTQILSGMAAEALCASVVSFNEVVSKMKPHAGQAECATNLRRFTHGSKLVSNDAHSHRLMARDDNCTIRTSPQWIGRVLDDLRHAHSQIVIEMNSVTDDPLIDASGSTLHGGNFQAKAVTSAVEKVRQSCQSMGQILFAQCSELMNPALNKGLPASLSVDEPDQSSVFKGIDILVAGLQSELGFLANPVGSHVHSAEAGFQGKTHHSCKHCGGHSSLNSLALVSGRYTLTAVDVLTQLAAAHLVALCQALDLRALHIQFLYALAPKFKALTGRCMHECIEPTSPGSGNANPESIYELWVNLSEQLNRTMHLDSRSRFEVALDMLQTRLLQLLPASQQTLLCVQQWNSDCVHEASNTYQAVRGRYLLAPDAAPVLGRASKRLYEFVRKKLEIPFFGSDYLANAEWDDGTSQLRGCKYRSMGAMISAVYEVMANGALYEVVARCMEDV